MTHFTDFISTSVIPSLGWTLLHSLWQSLLCLVVVILLLRCIPSTFSNVRYSIATVGLLVMFLLAAGTFIYDINSGFSTVRETGLAVEHYVPASASGFEYEPVSGLFARMKESVQSNMSLIVILWSIGALLSSLRQFTGWWYLRRVRHTAIEINNTWSDQLRGLAKTIGIDKWVTLAESARIHAPIVMGYVKPIVLIPVGMCAGLSTRQLESIFIHELIHIRRGDYIVNMIQAVLESLFFFNPFVWMVSAIMRREREHCCDDAVVAFHGNPMAYVHALATLEEARLSNSGLALSLAEDKNQLLNRIKRIMEKSVRNYSARERIVPLALLVVGLVCASWLTIQSGRSEEEFDTVQTKETTPADTTIREKKARYQKKKVTTIDENGNPADEVVETFEGDEDLREVLSTDRYFEPVMAIPAVPPVPGIGPELAIPPIPPFDFSFRLDTLSPPGAAFGGDWHEFSRAFEESFREKFSDFYEKHEEELKRMMDDMEFKFNHQFDHEWSSTFEDLARREEHLALLQENRNDQLQAEMHAREAAERVKDREKEAAVHREEIEKNMKALEDQMQVLEKSQRALFKELTTELVKDGYLKEGEKINKLQINDGNMSFNDKAIKASDTKKYKAIVDKYSFGPSEKDLRRDFSRTLDGRKE